MGAPGVTTEVYLGRGKNRKGVQLGKLLGEGAAGKVFTITVLPGAAAKLYHTEAEAKKHEAKIEAMIARPPDLPPALHEGKHYPQISWPEAKLHDRSGRFIGFLMPVIDFGRSTSLVNLLQKNSRRVEKLSEYYGYRVLVARNLASVFAELHKAGHHMIDMKPANLRFYPKVSWMAVVDTDGFSITGNHGRIPADQMSDEYIAPESWKRPIAELGVEQDLFALAVIIFQLLNNGVHPFAGGSKGARGQATDLQARILDGLYPYALSPRAGLEPSTASVHRMFRRATREMFDAAFVPGNQRPTAIQWRDHLDQLIGQLVPCTAKPDEHVHFGQGCGFCGHEARVEAARASLPATRPAGRVAVRKPARRPAQPLPAPLPPRTLTARPMPMLPAQPRMVQHYPLRKRERGGLWRAAAAVVLLGGVAYASQSMWLPLFQQPDANAQTPEPPIAPLDVPEAKLVKFDRPRDYLILPAGGGLSLPLHRGPGDDFPVLDRLSLHDAVVGRGSTHAKNGATWIYVTRASDGMSGFVPQISLLEHRSTQFGERAEKPAITGNLAVMQRYRALLDSSEGYDRSYLAEGQEQWEQERERCAGDIDPPSCRMSADERRIVELESWAGAQKATREQLQPADPGLAAGNSQR